jgi:hypothetical protein
MKKTLILFGIIFSLSSTLYSSVGKECLEKTKKEPQEVSDKEFYYLKWRTFQDPTFQDIFDRVPEYLDRQEKLLSAMRRYKKLTPETEVYIILRHQEALQFNWRVNISGRFNHVDLARRPETIGLRYRTWQDEVTSAKNMYPAPQSQPFAVRCNAHGWTTPLTEFACGDNEPLINALAPRAQTHNAYNMAKEYYPPSAFNARLRCFVFKTPFEKKHRPTVQKVYKLETYTSLHYVPPLLIASVIVNKESDEKFAKENPHAQHPDIHVFKDGQAAAFLEYMNDVFTDNTKLQRQTITTGLGQFYKEYDEELGKSVCINTVIPPADLLRIILSYLTYLPTRNKKPKAAQASNQLSPISQVKPAHAELSLIEEEDPEQPALPTRQLLAQLDPAITFFAQPGPPCPG